MSEDLSGKFRFREPTLDDGARDYTRQRRVPQVGEELPDFEGSTAVKFVETFGKVERAVVAGTPAVKVGGNGIELLPECTFIGSFRQLE